MIKLQLGRLDDDKINSYVAVATHVKLITIMTNNTTIVSQISAISRWGVSRKTHETMAQCLVNARRLKKTLTSLANVRISSSTLFQH